MTKEDKAVVLEDLKGKLEEYSFFYLADPTAMTAGQTNLLRRKCFEQGIEMQVVKNKIALKILKEADASRGYEGLFDAFKGQTAILFTKNQKAPAKLIEDFRKELGTEKPGFKGAYIDSATFVGEDQLAVLKKLKSREELIGEIVGLLQSPAKNVISALQGSAGQKIAGLVKALEERGA
ncbi:MAG: 50S ribosomal protein L10 [Saprospiraceae bacterium]|nr:50S ribosomal protein L10 [Saprospiraceae bacterium]